MTIRYVLRKAMGLTRIIRDRLLLIPFGIATAVIPRSPHRWVFGSWHGVRFADNPKYFFLHCHALKDSPVQAVWLSKNRDVVRSVRALRAYRRITARARAASGTRCAPASTCSTAASRTCTRWLHVARTR